MKSLFARILVAALLIAGAVRFVGSAVLPATRALSGDFAAVFPAHYVAALRPDFPADTWSGWRYGPMLHFLTLPLLLVPRWSLVPAVWAAINLAAVGVSFFLVLRLARGRVPPMAIALLAAMWLLFQPLVNCFAQGNIELLELAMILAAIVLLPRWKEIVSGVLIGSAAMTKFLPVGFLAWFLIKRHVRAFAAGVATIAIIAAITAVTLGWNDAATFREVPGSPAAPLSGVQQLSVTTMFLHRSAVLLKPADGRDHATPAWFPSDRAAAASRAGLVASVLLAAGFAIAIYRRRHQPASPEEIAVLFMTMFMILPWNHDYYYVFALVPLSLLLLGGIERRSAPLLGMTIAGYLLISPPLPFSWMKSDVFDYLDLPVLGALLVWITAAQQMFAQTAGAAAERKDGGLRWLAPAIAGIVLVCAGVLLLPASRSVAVAKSAGTALNVQPAVVLTGAPAMALSPDGGSLVYVAQENRGRVLCVRAIERGTQQCLAGTDGAEGPFFSPDGRWVGFFAGQLLKKVPLDGQPVQDIGPDRGARIARWETDGTILLATPTNGIMQVPAAGGTMETIVPPLERDGPYSWPMLLPRGDTVLFTTANRGGSFGTGWITAHSLRTGQRTRLFPGSQPHYDRSTGTLSYTLNGRIASVSFDPETLKASAVTTTLADNVLVTPDGGPFVAYSERGTVAYAPGSLLPVVRHQMVWVDRDGTAEPLRIEPDAFQTPRISPDGRRVVAAVRGVTIDLWTYDIAAGTPSRLTLSAEANDTPVWTPDGGIAFVSPARAGGSTVMLTSPSTDERTASRLWTGNGAVRLGNWAADGGRIVGTESGDLWMLEPRAIQAAAPAERWRTTIVRTAAKEAGAVLSPDGRSIAYASNESGKFEIYTQPVAPFAERRQVSQTGGTEPVWSRDGRELFYRSGDTMMAAAAGTTASRALFRGNFVAADGVTNYDVGPDGRRFLMLRDAAAAAPATPLTIASVAVR